MTPAEFGALHARRERALGEGREGRGDQAAINGVRHDLPAIASAGSHTRPKACLTPSVMREQPRASGGQVGLEDRAALRLRHHQLRRAGAVGDVGDGRARGALDEVRDLAARVEVRTRRRGSRARRRGRLSTSTAMPSGPLAPKNVRNAPTFVTDPSASNGPRHTAFARVTAMKITLPRRIERDAVGARDAAAQEVEAVRSRAADTRARSDRAARSVPGR